MMIIDHVEDLDRTGGEVAARGVTKEGRLRVDERGGLSGETPSAR